jgi:hypothetical protein
MYIEEVVPLASSRLSSNSPDWMDVAANLVAFQALSSCRLEIRMTAADDHGKADIRITILAHELKAEIGDQPPLASVSVTCSATRMTSLEAALIHALYQLDGQLGRLEFDGIKRTA